MKRYARSAVQEVSSRKSPARGQGWRVAADSSWGAASRMRRSMPGSASTRAWMPPRTSLAVSAPAPIPGSTPKRRCTTMGPASTAPVATWTVTPARAIPARNCQNTGSGPRKRGRAEGWRFSAPRPAVCRTARPATCGRQARRIRSGPNPFQRGDRIGMVRARRPDQHGRRARRQAGRQARGLRPGSDLVRGGAGSAPIISATGGTPDSHSVLTA